MLTSSIPVNFGSYSSTLLVRTCDVQETPLVNVVVLVLALVMWLVLARVLVRVLVLVLVFGCVAGAG
jgi:hypothetical protein